jgi:arsenate reductase (thioredoxin)
MICVQTCLINDQSERVFMNHKPKVAFVCVHNSCRSQIAEALAKFYNEDVFEAYSAGTETKPQLNQDAVRLMKNLYGIDMEETQKSKLIYDLPEIDIVITMGCNVECPSLPCTYREDWGLDDPSGQVDEVFLDIINKIDTKVNELAQRILTDEFDLK